VLSSIVKDLFLVTVGTIGSDCPILSAQIVAKSGHDNCLCFPSCMTLGRGGIRFGNFFDIDNISEDSSIKLAIDFISFSISFLLVLLLSTISFDKRVSDLVNHIAVLTRSSFVLVL
jgi:hypothetical protein